MNCRNFVKFERMEAIVVLKIENARNYSLILFLPSKRNGIYIIKKAPVQTLAIVRVSSADGGTIKRPFHK